MSYTTTAGLLRWWRLRWHLMVLNVDGEWESSRILLLLDGWLRKLESVKQATKTLGCCYELWVYVLLTS